MNIWKFQKSVSWVHDVTLVSDEHRKSFLSAAGSNSQWKCDTAGESDFCPAISGSSFLHTDLLLLCATAHPWRYDLKFPHKDHVTLVKAGVFRKVVWSGWSTVSTKCLQQFMSLPSSPEGKVSSLVVFTSYCLCAVTHCMWAGHTAGAMGTFVIEKLSGEALFLLICKYLSNALLAGRTCENRSRGFYIFHSGISLCSHHFK